MILIFGGTTEGRLAADVCEEAGKAYYYSTKGDRQKVELHNGIRLSGAMDADEMRRFCLEKRVELIIDAAHPFAENLHAAIGKAGIPVVRLQRDFGERIDGVEYCADFNDAIARMEKQGVERLLALSGVNTIERLRPFWQRHHTVFRILKRPESIEALGRSGLSEENVVYYNSEASLPRKEDERRLMLSVDCDAVITKETGAAGGFNEKVAAARELGLRVFAVCHPQLPEDWTYVSGRYSLRRAIENVAPGFFPLRTGLTTGACATAATKAALLSLLYDDCGEEVSFALPDKEILTIPVVHLAKGKAMVTKDHSDDPDVTRGCRIISEVALHEKAAGKDAPQKIRFLQGNGVGRVTLPGLGIPVGEPAVNPVPRRMIADEAALLTDKDVDVRISVENGAEIAKKTFNPRVGVVDGISILGTSGIVHPLSNEAFISSIRREVDVAWAIGRREIAFVAGMRSERALRAERDIRCVHYGNFVGAALKAAYDAGFRSVVLAIMIGKAVKLAEGHLDTHSHKVAMNKRFLSDLASGLGIDPRPISGITMARQLWDIMPPRFFDEIRRLCLLHCREAFPEGGITIRLVSDKL